MKTLVAVGTAFLDIVVRCPSPDLAACGKQLNEMRFLTRDQFLCVKKELNNPSIIPGGSAANATAIFGIVPLQKHKQLSITQFERA